MTRRANGHRFKGRCVFQLLTDRNLEERYEQFMRGEQDNLYAFLTRDCQLRPEEVRSVIRYSVDASDATVVKDKKREIHGFIRNAAGQVYLPGSSVKGAIRTALLLEKMQEELPEKDEDQRKRVLASRKREKEIPEGRYLNLLELRTRDGKVLDDAVNSIMRGLQISDSLPVPDSQMMLSKKVDVNQDGEAPHHHLRPGVHPAGSGAAFEADFGSISMQRQSITKRQSAANG